MTIISAQNYKKAYKQANSFSLKYLADTIYYQPQLIFLIFHKVGLISCN